MLKDDYLKISILLFSSVIFLAGINFHSYGSYRIDSENDFFNSYIPHAEKFLSGTLVVDDFRGPLYYAALGIIKTFTGNYFISGILISSVSSCIALFFIYGTIKRISGFCTAVIVTSFTAFNPVFIEYSYAPGTDMFCFALISGSIYFLLKKFSYKYLFAASAFASLAFLTRYNSGILFIVIPAALFFLHKQFSFVRRIKIAVSSAVVIIILIAPWGFYTLDRAGEIFYNENYKNIAIALEHKGEFQYDEAWNKNAGKYSSYAEIIKSKPVQLSLKIAGSAFLYLYNDIKRVIGWHWGIFLIPGIFFLFKDKNRKLALYLMIGGALFAVLLPVFYSPRFSFILIPFYGIICYSGILFFFKYLIRFKPVNRLKEDKKIFTRRGIYTVSKHINRFVNKINPDPKLLFISALLLATLLNAFHFNSYIMAAPDGFKTAVEKIESLNINIEEGEKISSLKPHIAYHLNLKWKPLPYDKSFEETINILTKEKVKYIFFSKKESEKRPKLRRLNNPDEVKDLAPVMQLKEEEIYLYEIK